MEEEPGQEARRKEEEDRAWWSDYQASTKLKRKWARGGDSEEDFDDILGDLDSIVQTTEEREEVKVKEDNDSQADTADISRQSSTSGYLTDTVSQEIKGKETFIKNKPSIRDYRLVDQSVLSQFNVAINLFALLVTLSFRRLF